MVDEGFLPHDRFPGRRQEARYSAPSGAFLQASSRLTFASALIRGAQALPH